MADWWQENNQQQQSTSHWSQQSVVTNQFIRITCMIIDQFEDKIKLIQSHAETALISAGRTALKAPLTIEVERHL